MAAFAVGDRVKNEDPYNVVVLYDMILEDDVELELIHMAVCEEGIVGHVRTGLLSK